jgi:hypothetical protein
MSELEKYDTEMSRWAKDAHEISVMASKLVTTSFVPASFNGKPAEATAAILTGLEVGLKPMAALRSIVVIQGTPALTAQALRGLVQSRGHRIWVEESTSQRAIVKGIRKGDEQVQTSTWDVARATALGLMNKPNYKNQAQAMFVARATSEMCRLIASDAILGLAYTVEELTDDSSVDEVPEKRPSRKVQRKPLEPAPVTDEGLDEWSEPGVGDPLGRTPEEIAEEQNPNHQNGSQS